MHYEIFKFDKFKFDKFDIQYCQIVQFIQICKNLTSFFTDDNLDHGVSKAYETVLILTLRKPDNQEYKDFAVRVKTESQLPPFNYTFPDNEDVRCFFCLFLLASK